MIEFRFLGAAQHQADAPAVEEREVGDLEEQAETQDVAVERGGALQFLDVDGDLGDAFEHEASLEIVS